VLYLPKMNYYNVHTPLRLQKHHSYYITLNDRVGNKIILNQNMVVVLLFHTKDITMSFKNKYAFMQCLEHVKKP
jgi:hypothetical protein